jgi:hypothetical protein
LGIVALGSSRVIKIKNITFIAMVNSPFRWPWAVEYRKASETNLWGGKKRPLAYVCVPMLKSDAIILFIFQGGEKGFLVCRVAISYSAQPDFNHA